MDLNDKIKKQDLLIEELNKDVDTLLSESILGAGFKALQFLIRGKKFIPTFIAGAAISKGVSELSDAKEELETTKIEKDVKALTKKISDLEKMIADVEEMSGEDGLKKITIEFKSEVSLDISHTKTPEFKRTLKNKMFFGVIENNEEEKYLILKTKSFKPTDFIKIKYTHLDTHRYQKGDANLIYSRYQSPDIKPLDGVETDCVFKILSFK